MDATTPPRRVRMHMNKPMVGSRCDQTAGHAKPQSDHQGPSREIGRGRVVGQWRSTTAGAVQTRHTLGARAVGVSEDLPLGTTPSPGASDTQANAQAKRPRSLGNNAQNRLATVLTAGALGAFKARCDFPQKR